MLLQVELFSYKKIEFAKTQKTMNSEGYQGVLLEW
jgi:hypothetical protein